MPSGSTPMYMLRAQKSIHFSYDLDSQQCVFRAGYLKIPIKNSWISAVTESEGEKGIYMILVI
jgi:hypothetical protein